MEITGSTELHKRMRFWFVQEISKEEGLLKFIRERCDDLRRKSVRRHTLIREMEALGDRGVVVDSLESLKQSHARETAKLSGLTDVLAETLAGIHEKEGHDFREVDDIDFSFFPLITYNLFGFVGDAADLYVVAIHGGWRWWSVGDVGNDDNLPFTMRSSSTPVSWLGSHTESVIAAMLGVVSGIALPVRPDKLYTGSKDETIRVWDFQDSGIEAVLTFALKTTFGLRTIVKGNTLHGFNQVMPVKYHFMKKLLRKDGLHEVVQDFSAAARRKLFEQEIREVVVSTEFLINIKRDEDVENLKKLLAEEECISGARIY
ncbi:hypothetical protein Tco_0236856 [Tanacetum coccineum]